MGGENRGRPGRNREAPGSSPRGRGKLLEQPNDAGLRRLIPAWAGKTTAPEMVVVTAGAHPRVGGENARNACPSSSTRGSSPRGRGKPKAPKTVKFTVRLIPAWAGKTSPQTTRRSRTRAHPRVGGENLIGGCLVAPGAGSSPRGRGKPLTKCCATTRSRLIPAWAGKTLSDLRFYQADRSDLGNP